jgi:hypothetical protein
VLLKHLGRSVKSFSLSVTSGSFSRSCCTIVGIPGWISSDWQRANFPRTANITHVVITLN